jgi:hypothetical protein
MFVEEYCPICHKERLHLGSTLYEGKSFCECEKRLKRKPPIGHFVVRKEEKHDTKKR